MRTLPKVLLLSLAMLWSGGLSLAYEEPDYKVLKTYSLFELRQYEAYVVAETQVSGAFDDCSVISVQSSVLRVKLP